jgi:hypothetical protein
VTLPKGPRAWAIHEGQSLTKSQDGTISKLPQDVQALPRGVVFPFPYHTPLFASSLAFPYGQLATALTDSSLNISYQGIVQLDGHSVHDIRLQRLAPGGTVNRDDYHTKDLFFDTSSLRLLMAQDVISQIRYLDYRTINSLVVPFSINQQIGSQQSWAVQISQINFNTGLQASDFEIQ